MLAHAHREFTNTVEVKHNYYAGLMNNDFIKKGSLDIGTLQGRGCEREQENGKAESQGRPRNRFFPTRSKLACVNILARIKVL